MALDETDYLCRPVRSLQAMLRQISYTYPVVPRLVPDGLFGEETLEAVMVFQREFHLPVTGTVNNATWDAIVLAYANSSKNLEKPLPANGFPDRLFTFSPGDHCIYLFMIQAMFNALSYILEEVEPVPVDGIHTGGSVRNTKWIQRKGNIKETGVMGKDEWNLLVRVYEAFLIRSNEPDVCQLLDLPPASTSKTQGQW